MRVLFLQSSSIFEGYGGVEYYQDDLLTLAAEAFPEAEFRTVIPQRTEAFDRTERPYQIDVVRFSSKRWMQKLQNRFSYRYLQTARESVRELRPTLIVAGHIAVSPIAAWLSREFDIPLVIIAYGIEIWGDLWPQENWALGKAKGVLSISRWTERILRERDYPADRMQVVHPPLPAEYEKVPVIARTLPANRPLTLLTVSRLDAREQYKGQDHVLQALQRIKMTEPDCHFHYIIQGEGTDRERLVRMTHELGIEDWVEFRGAVRDRAEFEAAYREADLFVMPSRFGMWDHRWRGEGFGIVYLEAAACGVPSLAYDCGGATDIIRHGENGVLVDPDNIAELSRTLLHLDKNRSFVLEMGSKAREIVLRDFTRSATQAQLRDALTFFHRESS